MHFTKSAVILVSLFWATTLAMPIDSASTIEARVPNGVGKAGDIVGEIGKALPGPAGAILGTVAAGLKAGGGKGAAAEGAAAGGKGAAAAAGGEKAAAKAAKAGN